MNYIHYSGEIVSRDNGRLHVTRAVLCPDMSMVFGEFQHRSMRELTSRETTPALTRWLRCRPLLNVVAVDFAGMGDVIGIIIRLNHAKKTVTDVWVQLIIRPHKQLAIYLTGVVLGTYGLPDLKSLSIFRFSMIVVCSLIMFTYCSLLGNCGMTMWVCNYCYDYHIRPFLICVRNV